MNINFWRVTELPKSEDVRGKEIAIARTAAPFIGAYSESETIIIAWIREKPFGPISILIGGDKSIGSRGQASRVGNEGRLIFPLGAYGLKQEVDTVTATLDSFQHWTRCDIVHSMSVDEHRAEQRESRPQTTFEEYVAHLLTTPFAWMIVAAPVKATDIASEIQKVERRIRVLNESKESAPNNRVQLERFERRLRELEQARWKGLWDLQVLVGSVSEIETRRVAALLCAGTEISHGDYALVPGEKSEPSNEGILRSILNTTQDDNVPFYVSSDVLAYVARLPRRELPGIRLVTPHTFDVTPEQAGGLPLGIVLDSNLSQVGTFEVPKSTLNRHAFVCGATGSGKSQTVRALLECLSEATSPIPWLVIEPAKAEYARMAGRLAGRHEVLVIRPGDPDAIPVSLNPLEPEPGFPLQTHIDLVRALFLAAFEAEEPFPQILSAALTRCYENLGWDLVTGVSKFPPLTPRYPSLNDLQSTALDVVENIGYGREVTDNVRGFIDVRIGSLRMGTPGRFFEGGHPLDITELLQRNVVIEIEDIGNDQDKAFLIGTVLIRLVEHLRVQRGKNETPVSLQHITVVEEAHRLLKNVPEGSPAAQAVELFAGLLAEVRAYGEGIIVAEQIPSKILPDVIKNTALKVVHRLPAQDDRVSVGATMNLDAEQSQYVVTLKPGVAAIFVDGMDRPMLVQMPLGEERESARAATRNAPIKRLRSLACGMACQTDRPCTLREMTIAARLAEDAKFTLWIEMLVVAHLTGMTVPTASPTWLEGVRTHEWRTVECAVSQSIQAAVDARYPELALVFQSVPERLWDVAAQFTPERLAAHVGDVALAQVNREPKPCKDDEIWFQAGWYRWLDIQFVFELVEEEGEAIPLELIKIWKQERGLQLAGNTLAEQLDSLFRQPAYLRSRERIIHGVASPSRISAAVAHLSDATDWQTKLADALAFLDFGSINWTREHVMESTSQLGRK